MIEIFHKSKDSDKAVVLKYAITAGIFVLTILSCYVPWFIKTKVKNSSQVMSYLNCLAGGVVLSTLLLHMIPHTLISCEQKHHKHEAGKKNDEPQYPFGLLAAGLSFLLLLAIDRLFLTHTHCVDLGIDFKNF